MLVSSLALRKLLTYLIRDASSHLLLSFSNIDYTVYRIYPDSRYTINLNRYTDKEFFDIDNLPARYFFSHKVFCVNNIANF